MWLQIVAGIRSVFEAEHLAPNFPLSDYRLPNGSTGLDVVEAVTKHIGAPVHSVIHSSVVSPKEIKKIKASGAPLFFNSDRLTQIISPLWVAIETSYPTHYPFGIHNQ